jgi:hypothetical protein
MRITSIPAASRSRTTTGPVAAPLDIVTMTGAERLQAGRLSKVTACRLSDFCPVPSHFFRLIARFPFTSFAVAAITSQKNADCRAQS